MSNASCMNNFLVRCPLSGPDIQGNHEGVQGQIAKSLSIISKIALLIIASLAIANICPVQIAAWSFIGLPILSFTFYAIGSSEKRSIEAFFFEFIIRNVCFVMGLLALIGTVTNMQVGIAILSTVSGGVIISGCFGKDFVQKLNTDSIAKSESNLLLSEEGLSEEMPSLPVRILDKLIGIGRDITFITGTLFSYFTHQKNYAESVDLENKNSSGLCVLIHGLKGLPSMFDDYHDEFEAHMANKITIFQPHVQDQGNCRLEEAAENILQQTINWSKVHPNKPIVLIGVSNGARIAGYVTAKLKSEEKIQNPMMAHCIAGPFFGTKIVNQPDWPEQIRPIWGDIFKTLHSDEVYDELSWGSSCAQNVIQGMQAVSKDVSFNFYSSFSDAQVQSFTSALPNVPFSNHYVTSAEGHQSIVRAVKDPIVEDSMRFINAYK